MASARQISDGELPQLLDLYRMLNPDDPRVDPDVVRERWTEMRDDEHVVVVVVEHDDRLVATCLLSMTPNLTRGARPFAVVENVVTHEDYRGEGFGTQCVEAAVDVARERDCYKVMLLTGADQAWKHDFYEACGFDPEEKTGFVTYLS